MATTLDSLFTVRVLRALGLRTPAVRDDEGHLVFLARRNPLDPPGAPLSGSVTFNSFPPSDIDELVSALKAAGHSYDRADIEALDAGRKLSTRRFATTGPRSGGRPASPQISSSSETIARTTARSIRLHQLAVVRDFARDLSLDEDPIAAALGTATVTLLDQLEQFVDRADQPEPARILETLEGIADELEPLAKYLGPAGLVYDLWHGLRGVIRKWRER